MKLITMIFFFTVAHTKKTTPIKGSIDHKISGNEHNNSLRQRKNSYDKKYIPPRQLEVSLVKLLQVKCFTITLTVFKFQNQSYTLYLHVHIIFLNWPSWSDFSLIVVHYVRWERRGEDVLSIITETYDILVGVVLRALSLFMSFCSNAASKMHVLVASLTEGLDRQFSKINCSNVMDIMLDRQIRSSSRVVYHGYKTILPALYL